MTSNNTLVFETACSDIAAGELTLQRAVGKEAMSRLYWYKLELLCTRQGGIPLEHIDGMLKAPCYMALSGTDSVEIHGVLKNVSLLHSTDENQVRYRAILAPRLWNTTRSHRTRVYQNMNIQEIVDEVLALSGLEAEWHLIESYPKSEYIVQYDETDYHFISRLLEHWGIYFYFRQEPDGEVLVIADNNIHFQPLMGSETLTFDAQTGRSAAQGCVHRISAHHRPRSAGLAVREYNWEAPSTPLLESHDVDTRAGFGVHWHYGDHFKDPDQGKVIARIRAEQMLNRRETYGGRCSVPGLAPGHKFDLTGAALSDLEFTYLVTSVSPDIKAAGDGSVTSYEYHFTAFPLDRQDPPPPAPYRASRRRKKPKIRGFMHGIVDGEILGLAAPIDLLGRYKVILPMDSVAVPGGKATRWIRMAQASSGPDYGIHFPLHIGTEVAIIHLDGDPDRPLILGSVPNAETKTPVLLTDATQSRIKTKTGILVEWDDDA